MILPGDTDLHDLNERPDTPPSFPDAPEARRTLTIRNSRGLHARAAGKFVRTARAFDAQIWVMREDMVVSADSILGLMMLAASPGSTIEVWVRGREAEAALDALMTLVNRGFDEDVTLPS